MIGQGGVTAWIKSSTPDVDLQATISEIRPDGKETFVQGGWVRAKARKLTATVLAAADAFVDFSAYDIRAPIGEITPDELHLVGARMS